MIAHAVLHATLLAIVGYALLFSATRTAGIVALIGRLLGIWVFIVAALFVAAAIIAPPPDRAFAPWGMMHGGPGMHPWGPPPGPPAMQPAPGPQQPPPPKP
jgi:hypothetical protein